MRTKAIFAVTMAVGSLLAVTSPANAASFTFTTIDGPSGTGTSARGINGVGQIVGSFLDPPSNFRGFLYTGGSFITFDAPGTGPSVFDSDTEPWGINDAGQIVGFFRIPSESPHGFIRDINGNFTTLDVPGAGFTEAFGINNRGQIVGYFVNSTGTHGFLYSAGSFITLDVPGAATTEAFGINDAGQVVGFYDNRRDTGDVHGFLYTGGTFTTLDVPGGVFTQVKDINDAGQIVGGFISGSVVHGFLNTDGIFTSIDVPGALATNCACGIDAGQIVGTFQDKQTGASHGFLATPVSAVPEPSSLVLLGLGVIGLSMLRRHQRLRSNRCIGLVPQKLVRFRPHAALRRWKIPS